MFLEYDWVSNTYKPRFGQTFIAVNGWLSFETLNIARDELSIVKLRLGKKTDSRTWRIELAEAA